MQSIHNRSRPHFVRRVRPCGVGSFHRRHRFPHPIGLRSARRDINPHRLVARLNNHFGFERARDCATTVGGARGGVSGRFVIARAINYSTRDRSMDKHEDWGRSGHTPWSGSHSPNICTSTTTWPLSPGGSGPWGWLTIRTVLGGCRLSMPL